MRLGSSGWEAHAVGMASTSAYATVTPLSVALDVLTGWALVPSRICGTAPGPFSVFCARVRFRWPLGPRMLRVDLMLPSIVSPQQP